MTVQHSSFVSDADGIEIATSAWPDVSGETRGVVQIAHGLAEHAARYGRFAEALNAAGYLVVATDHRGHGRTGQHQLGDFGSAGFDGLIADVAQYGAAIASAHPGLPVVLFGHSMGSFAAQAVIVDHADQYAAVVLSGSSAMDVLAAGMADPDPDAPAGLEAFNVGFEHRTGYEWLSRDDAEVDEYVADPWCGFDVPDETLPQLFGPAARLADPEQLAAIRSDLPILIASGRADPLAGDGELVRLLGSRYEEAGVADVTVNVYDGARHEILNETNRDEITADIIAWIDDHVSTPVNS